MGLINNIRDVFTKAPTFNSTTKSTWDDFSNVLKSENYLDQYFGWTYKAVKLKADTATSYDQILFSGDDEIERKNNELLRDLHRFNEFQTFREARKITMMHLSLAGMAAWHISKTEAVGFDQEFFILDPQRLSIIKSEVTGLPVAYRYSDADGKIQEIDRDNLVIFRNPNPQNWFGGYSDLQASRYAHNTYQFASLFNMNQFANNGKPEGFIIAEGISETERKRMESMLRQKYSTPQNARKTGIVNRAMTWMQITNNNVELDYINGMDRLKKEILGIHGIPSIMIDPSDATFANASEAQRIFQRNTIKPMLEIEMDTFNEQLIRKYYLGKPSRSRGLEFRFEDPVEADKERQANTVAILFEKQIITREEAREEIGMEPDADGEFFKPVDSQMVENAEKQLQKVEKSLKEVDEFKKGYKQLPEVVKSKELKREQLKSLFHEKSVKDELFVTRLMNKVFDLQLDNLLNQVKSHKTPSIKIALNSERADVESIGVLLPAIEQLVQDNERLGNTLMKGTQYSFTRAAKDALIKDLTRALEESNKTTKKDVSEILGGAIGAGITSNELAKQVRDYFRNQQYGITNVRTLRDTGVWFDNIVVDDQGIRRSEKNMFKVMFERANALNGNEKVEALNALHNIVSISDDPVASEITRRIEEAQNIEKGVTSRSRAVVIALLLAGITQSKVLSDLYLQNPEVERKEWVSAKDSFVRTGKFDHVTPDGQKVLKEENFTVSGEQMFEPRDMGASLGNIINCRCVSVPSLD